jgi:hypothetical protein
MTMEIIHSGVSIRIGQAAADIGKRIHVLKYQPPQPILIIIASAGQTSLQVPQLMQSRRQALAVRHFNTPD